MRAVLIFLTSVPVDKALKMKWIKYMIQKPDTPLGVMMLKNIEKYKETLWHANMTVKDSKIIFQFSNTFVKNIMKAYYELTFDDLKDAIKPELLRQPLWLNTHICVQRKIIFYKTMFERVILAVKDIMKNTTIFYTYHELCDRYNYSFNVMEYNSLLSAIPWKWILLRDSSENDILCDDILDIMLFSNQSCKQIYKKTCQQNNINTNMSDHVAARIFM